MLSAQLKVMVIATQRTPLAARISIALVDEGFSVAALTPHGHPVRRSRKIKDHFAYRTRPRLKTIIHAINRWSPGLLVCVDDLAVRELQLLHQRAAASGDEALRHITELIELSLGPPASFPAIQNKSDFLADVATEGIRCPATIVIPANRAFKSVPDGLVYPVMVKADQSQGGLCVRVARSEADVLNAVWELQTPSTWRGIYRRCIGAILGSRALSVFTPSLRRTTSLQQFIPGRPGNRAVICWKGKVLAGISVEAVEVQHEYGPASIVRLIDHSEMAAAAEHIVKHLNLSGFVGFDFILDSSNQAWIIEMNPRVTPICHFILDDGTSLVRSLYNQMNGLQPSSAPVLAKQSLIALFPGAFIRSPSSDLLQSCEHDIPWNEPEFVCCVLNQALQEGIHQRVRTFLERYLPVGVGTLVRLGLADARRENRIPG